MTTAIALAALACLAGATGWAFFEYLQLRRKRQAQAVAKQAKPMAESSALPVDAKDVDELALETTVVLAAALFAQSLFARAARERDVVRQDELTAVMKESLSATEWEEFVRREHMTR
jgi:hypothetical protein